MSQKLVGDGCQYCNPEKTEEIMEENRIEDSEV
jgi:hypothetical protein